MKKFVPWLIGFLLIGLELAAVPDVDRALLKGSQSNPSYRSQGGPFPM
jgi:hypothetical protein